MDTNQVVDTGMALYGQKVYIESTGNKERDNKNVGRIKKTLECYVNEVKSEDYYKNKARDFLTEGLDDPMHSVPNKNTYYGPESDEVYRDGAIV